MTAPSVRHPGEFRWETRLLAVVTLVLTVFGVANCYGTGTYLATWHEEASQQLVGALFGGVIFLGAAYTDYHIWRRLARPLFYVTLASLAIMAAAELLWPNSRAPSIVGSIVPRLNGARRWIRLGGIMIQVSEIARFTLIVFIALKAVSLGNRIRDFRKGFIPLAAPVIVTAALVAAEPNLSMGVLLWFAGAMVIFTGGARIPHLILMSLSGAACAVIMIQLTAFRSDRLDSMSGSAQECVPTEQVCESLIGYGSGGVTGVGFGEGTQKLGHVPYGYSDFILSVIAEEWGLIGVTFTALCFAMFCWMGFRIAKTAGDPFGTLLAGGLTTMVGVAAFLHAAVVTRMIPATGLTLPFMSAGRVSLVMYLFSAGVIVSIGRRRGRPSRR